MPVGTGSINRAARNSKKTTEVVKNETKVAQDEIVKAEAAVTEKPAEKLATQKKPAAKKTTATKKTTSAKKPAQAKATSEKAEPKKAPELRVYGDETVFVVGNECCHLTEELPVHLL